MKYIPFFLLMILSLTSCGKRGMLTPSAQEDVPYPRQYPHAEHQNPDKNSSSTPDLQDDRFQYTP
jgi:predicted small lipoprotein YifL